MKNKEFDLWVQDKVKEYEKLSAEGGLNSSVKSDWEEMSRRLTLDQNEKNFDSKVKSSFQNASILSSEANWENFQKRLELIRQRRTKILTTRVVELALILLIFWTIQAVVDQDLIKIKPVQHGVIAHEEASAIQSKDLDLNHVDKVNSLLNTRLAKTEKVDDPVTLKTKEVVRSRPITRSTKSNYNSTLDNTLDSKTILQSSISERNEVNDPVKSIRSTPIIESESPVNLQNSNTLLDMNATLIDSAQSLSVPKSTETIIHSAKDEPSISEKKEETIPVIDFELITPKKSENKVHLIWIGTSFGYNNYSILSSEFVPNYINRNKIHASAISKNLRMAFNYPKWMIEVGADFSNVKYDPEKYLNFSKFPEGTRIDIIKKMSFQLLELPFILHYKMFESPKLDLLAFSGMSLVICNKAKYKRVAAISPARRQSLSFNPDDYSEQVSVNYNHGIREDHSSKGNSFSNVFIGLKLNYKILDYFILSSDINYKKMLGDIGFGPIDQKFKSINFNIGMYYTLN